MKVVLVGGGTGGHFYPLIAVAEALRKEAQNIGITDLKLYYFSTGPYDRASLERLNIIFKKIPAGKRRAYASHNNFFDIFVMAYGIVIAFFKLFFLYPDIVFSKGGYASFPTLVIARLLNIPVVIHESDTIPGRVSKWSAKFAKRIAVSWPETIKFFPQEKTAVTGQPIREELFTPIREGAFRTFNLDEAVHSQRPTIAIFGGSQGAQSLNEVILDVLPQLLQKYNIIHQTGEKNFKDVEMRSRVVLEKMENPPYRAYPFLSEDQMRKVASFTDLIISRAGSFIFEIASWGIPALLVPLSEDIAHDQRTNAFSYARTGAGTVLEQTNLTPTILLAEIDRIVFGDAKLAMKQSALAFAPLDAAAKIAHAILELALEHENY